MSFHILFLYTSFRYWRGFTRIQDGSTYEIFTLIFLEFNFKLNTFCWAKYHLFPTSIILFPDDNYVDYQFCFGS